MGLSIIILAAGSGKRMQSNKPKVLHRIAGKALLEHVVETALALQPDQVIVVVGFGGEEVKQTLAHLSVTWANQGTQQGTGDAVKCAMPFVKKENQVLILYGDVPLVSQPSLRSLYAAVGHHELGLMTAYFNEPDGYGRVLRDRTDRVIGVVEAKDASNEQLLIQEINTGIYLLGEKQLSAWLSKLSKHNAQNEYYLTDIIGFAAKSGVKIVTTQVNDAREVLGVNDREQLALLERYYQKMMTDALMKQGVTLIDPARVDLRGEISIGRDVTIDVNVILKGKVSIESDCHIGAHVILKNVTLGSNVRIEDFCHIEDAVIHAHAVVGPYARLRPGSEIGAHAKVGNFVEIKNSKLDAHVKVNHLSYVGDATIGEGSNIGAGTITCNYDGVNKHKTTIGKRVFVGSDCQLVAPVTLGDDAFIGAGSTITQNAPANQLTLSRSPQKTIEHWLRPKKSN